ncbi:DinB family protein [Flavobacteriaceae bacterium]|nr:DinB family protein [Flavobacteriaceae bacterium]
MNIQPHQIVLSDLKNLMRQMNTSELTNKNKVLSKASIGEHFRHIIEFYQCCISQKESGFVNYDLRKRNKNLEENPNFGIQTIETILNYLSTLHLKDDTPLLLGSGEESQLPSSDTIQSSFFRELAYCLDHCIHHQSLIKIGLMEQGLDHLIDDNFGVAFSTQKHREECAS